MGILSALRGLLPMATSAPMTDELAQGHHPRLRRGVIAGRRQGLAKYQRNVAGRDAIKLLEAIQAEAASLR